MEKRFGMKQLHKMLPIVNIHSLLTGGGLLSWSLGSSPLEDRLPEPPLESPEGTQLPSEGRKSICSLSIGTTSTYTLSNNCKHVLANAGQWQSFRLANDFPLALIGTLVTLSLTFALGGTGLLLPPSLLMVVCQRL